jgi:hypothetical protein
MDSLKVLDLERPIREADIKRSDADIDTSPFKAVPVANVIWLAGSGESGDAVAG